MQITEPVLRRKDFIYQEQYDNAIYSAELLAESYTLEGLNNLLEKDTRNKIYKHSIYLKSKESKWYEDKSNFPCMLIADISTTALVWVHYQIDGIAYDVRDNGYRLIEHTNWRRATKQEIMDNIKGL